MLAKVYDKLNDNGFFLTPVDGKRPIGNGWQNRENDDSWVEKYADKGVGVVLRDSLIAIDIDVLDEGLASIIRGSCYEALGTAPTRYGKRPKSLLLYRLDGGASKRKLSFKMSEFEKPLAVEILGNGQQFVAYGTHPETNQPYLWDTNITDELAELSIHEIPKTTIKDVELWLSSLVKIIVKGGGSDLKFDGFTPEKQESKKVEKSQRTVVGVIDDNPFEGISKPIDDGDVEAMRQNLKSIGHRFNPSDYDDWIKVGMSLKRWHENHGLALWREWSASGGYDGSACDDKWRYLTDNGGAKITEATIIYEAKKIERAENKKTIEERIAQAQTSQELEGKIKDDIKEMELTDLARDTVCQLWRRRYGEITEIKPSIAIVRNELRKVRREKIVNHEENRPEFLRNWYWLNSKNVFFNVVTKQEMTTLSFNHSFNHFMRDIDEENQFNAASFATANKFAPSYEGIRYSPQDALFFNDGAMDYINSFDRKSVPKAADEITEDGQKAIDTVLRHFSILCGNREKETRHLIDWLAYYTQNMGKRVNYAPLIQGYEGSGKSTMVKVIQSCLGRKNILQLEADRLQEKFTGWAENHCMVVFEELRMTGHSRYDVINHIKTYITNDFIDVRRMGKDNYNIPNTTGYIAFTNFKDALPVNYTDRRWWILFSPFANNAEFEAFIGEASHLYFNRLHSSIDYHGDAIRWYFLNHQISVDFDPKKGAPVTDEKLSMIDAETGDEINDLAQIVREGGDGFNKNIIASSMLITFTKNHFADDSKSLAHLLNTQTIRRTMEKLGFIKNPKQIKWRGTPHRVWNKSHLHFDADICRKLLDGVELSNALSDDLDDF